jgi:hypothetical protein
MKSSYCHATLRSSKHLLPVIKYPCTRSLFYPTNIACYCQLTHRKERCPPIKTDKMRGGTASGVTLFLSDKTRALYLWNITFDSRPNDRLSQPTVSCVSSVSCSFKTGLDVLLSFIHSNSCTFSYNYVLVF